MGASGGRHGRRAGALASLAGAMLVAVTACAGNGATPRIIYITPTPGAATPTPAATPAPTPTPVVTPTSTPTPAATLAPTPLVGAVTITAAAPDARWTMTFRKPVVSGVAPAAVALINAAITAKVNAMVHDYNGSELPVPATGDGPSTYQGNFSVAYASPTVLSIRLTGDQYVTGAAHNSHIAAGINLDVATGAVITLASVFTSLPAALNVLSVQSRALLIAQLGSDDVATINGGTTAVLANFDKAWVFTLGGLELTFQEYAVAAYAVGSPTIVIAWADLSTHINPVGPGAEFMP